MSQPEEAPQSQAVGLVGVFSHFLRRAMQLVLGAGRWLQGIPGKFLLQVISELAWGDALPDYSQTSGWVI